MAVVGGTKYSVIFAGNNTPRPHFLPLAYYSYTPTLLLGIRRLYQCVLCLENLLRRFGALRSICAVQCTCAHRRSTLNADDKRPIYFGFCRSAQLLQYFLLFSPISN